MFTVWYDTWEGNDAGRHSKNVDSMDAVNEMIKTVDVIVVIDNVNGVDLIPINGALITR